MRRYLLSRSWSFVLLLSKQNEKCTMSYFVSLHLNLFGRGVKGTRGHFKCCMLEHQNQFPFNSSVAAQWLTKWCNPFLENNWFWWARSCEGSFTLMRQRNFALIVIWADRPNQQLIRKFFSLVNVDCSLTQFDEQVTRSAGEPQATQTEYYRTFIINSKIFQIAF